MYRDVTEERTTDRDLARAHDLLAGISNAIPGVIYAKDRAGRMLYANDGTIALVGKPRSEFIGTTDAEFLGDRAQAAAVMANDRRIMEGGVAEQVEEAVRFPGGETATFLSTKAPLRDAQGAVTGLIGVSVDISARKATEAQLLLANQQLERQAAELTTTNRLLSEALAHRDLLLREVYHRVKNNMQIVDSLLVMQDDALRNPAATRALAGLRSRVFALGLVHHQLMGSTDLQTFDVAKFLQELTANIVDGGVTQGVCVDVSADPFPVGLDFGIPLGLLTTELVTNALKHAFPGGRGRISVVLSRNADATFDLIVSDDGTGYDHGAALPGAGLGKKIIAALVSQLKGTMRIEADQGTRVEIRMAPPHA